MQAALAEETARVVALASPPKRRRRDEGATSQPYPVTSREIAPLEPGTFPTAAPGPSRAPQSGRARGSAEEVSDSAGSDSSDSDRADPLALSDE